MPALLSRLRRVSRPSRSTGWATALALVLVSALAGLATPTAAAAASAGGSAASPIAPAVASAALAPTAQLDFPSMDVAVAVISPAAAAGIVPATISFDGTGSYCLEVCSITSWEWTFGDGAGASGPLASHTYLTSGLYTVTLTVHSSNGLTGTTSIQVNAWTYTLGSFTMTPTRGLVPLAVAFDASASVSNWDRPIVSYAWDFGDGTTGSGRLVSHTYTTPAVRQVALTVTDSMGGYQTVGGYVFVQDPMLPPTSLKATSPTKGAVKLSWTNRMVLVSELNIERCAGSSCTSFVPIFVTQGTTTSFSESGLKSGTTFRYRIRVVDYLGNTGYSSIVSVKTR